MPWFSIWKFATLDACAMDTFDEQKKKKKKSRGRIIAEKELETMPLLVSSVLQDTSEKFNSYDLNYYFHQFSR